MGFRPSHRDPEAPQPEICDVTGYMVPQSDLIESNVQGLRGASCCSIPRGLRRFRFAQSFHDRRRTQPGPLLSQGGRRQDPTGGDIWFDDGNRD